MSNFIFGKVKKAQNYYRILSTDSEVYEVPNLEDSVVYDPSILLEDDQIYKFPLFSTTEYAIPLLREELSSATLDQIPNNKMKDISYIFTIKDELIFFQNIASSSIVSKSWISFNEPILQKDNPIIVLGRFADIIYNKITDELFFKKLSMASKIFRGMEMLYKEATDEETQTFLNNEFIQVEVNFNLKNVSVPNRKRITLVQEILNTYDNVQKEQMYNYIREYSRVHHENGKFKIETDDHLKDVLWGIQQRYYTTPIGGEKRIANSVITISE